MNNSQRTKGMAHGIYLWACLQDQPSLNRNTAEYKAWKQWENDHTRIEIEYVQSEQFNLFDRCLAMDWTHEKPSDRKALKLVQWRPTKTTKT